MLPLWSTLPLAMLPLTLLRFPPTPTTMPLLMTTLELPSTRLSPMMELELSRDLTPSTSLTAVSRLSTTRLTISRVLSPMSATPELLSILKLSLLLTPSLTPLLTLLPPPSLPTLWPILWLLLSLVKQISVMHLIFIIFMILRLSDKNRVYTFRPELITKFVTTEKVFLTLRQ